MVKADKTKSVSFIFQQRLSLFLITVLVIIGGVVVWTQNQYDPAAWRQLPGNEEMPASQPAAQRDLPDGLTPLSPPENYNSENLSDKINGKADLYLGAGFKSLEASRWGLVADETRWMERYLYDMGGHQNAFAVFSLQRRQEIQDIDLTPHSYLSANGLFLVHGPFYMEIVAAEASSEIQSQMKALAQAFISSHPIETESLPVLELFPREDRLPHSRKLIADSAFGIQRLDWIYTAVYASGDAQATVFISKRQSAEEARELAEVSMAYWKEYGGEAVQAPEGRKGTQIVFILDNYEIAETKDDYIYGVHEATHLDFALALISRVRQTIDQGGK